LNHLKKGKSGNERAPHTFSSTWRIVLSAVACLAIISVIPSAVSAEENASDSVARLDSVYNYKGWAIRFPSFADTLLKDVGGFRSALAKAGFGFLTYSGNIFSANVLDKPREVPDSYPSCTSTNHLRGICANNQAYFGQSPAYWFTQVAYLTYDMGRLGLKGGQLAVSAILSLSTDEGFYPNAVSFTALALYQPLFDGKLEIKLGWFPMAQEMIGTQVGGNYANPFGPSSSIPVELGLSSAPNSSPATRIKWNITDRIYNQFVVQRSYPVRGPTGNPIYDEVHSDDYAGLNFTSPIPGTGALFMDEIGYKTKPLPGTLGTWFRAGGMYNTSQFSDLSRLTSGGGTKSNVYGFYALLDQQLWQQAPSSPLTAFRGIYLGATAMYTPPETAPFYQYYEGRLYWMGAFNSRPTDMISLVYNHNEISSDLADAANAGFEVTRVGVRHSTNTLVATYLAHIIPGVYASVGLSYTDHPSASYFPSEGPALNAIASLFVNY